jgi:hypothetical protein
MKSMKSISICVKCSDMFSAALRNNGKVVGQYEGYVPDFFPGEHYGDYVRLEIDVDTGRILNWNKPTVSDLGIFKPDKA